MEFSNIHIDLDHGIINDLDQNINNLLIDKIDTSISDVDSIMTEIFEKHLIYDFKRSNANESRIKESWEFLKRIVESKKREIEDTNA